jgi:hypothetical protein
MAQMIKKEYESWTFIGTYMKERSDMIMSGHEVVEAMIQEKDQYIIGWITYIRGYVIYQKKTA